jgi:transcription elongation GreA/GreB family factor
MFSARAGRATFCDWFLDFSTSLNGLFARKLQGKSVIAVPQQKTRKQRQGAIESAACAFATHKDETMSRAFVKETAESAPPPERMVEDGPNLVTPEGLAQIEGHVARIEDALAAETNPLLRETLARDLRYWSARKATAQVVRAPSTAAAEIMFGSRVAIARKGRAQRFRIVGVDEADPVRGLISIRSPSPPPSSARAWEKWWKRRSRWGR